jgi:hypothetical protein
MNFIRSDMPTTKARPADVSNHLSELTRGLLSDLYLGSSNSQSTESWKSSRAASFRKLRDAKREKRRVPVKEIYFSGTEPKRMEKLAWGKFGVVPSPTLKTLR